METANVLVDPKGSGCAFAKGVKLEGALKGIRLVLIAFVIAIFF